MSSVYDNQLDAIFEIQDMDVLCGNPDLLGWMKKSYLSKGLKQYERKFLTGFFGEYETDNSIKSPKDIFWRQHKKAKAYTIFGGHKPFNFFKQNCRAAS